MSKRAHACVEEPRELDFTAVKVRATAHVDPDDVLRYIESSRRPKCECHLGDARERGTHGPLGDYAHLQTRALRAGHGHRLTGVHAECIRFARNEIDARIAKDVAFCLNRAPRTRHDDGERRFTGRPGARKRASAPELPVFLPVFLSREFDANVRQRDASKTTGHVSNQSPQDRTEWNRFREPDAAALVFGHTYDKLGGTRPRQLDPK
jgi:hypothetical protein